MKIWNAIRAIKSKSKLKELEAELREIRIKKSGKNDCSLQMAENHATVNFKVNGIAYFKDLCLSHANSIVHKASIRSHFIPPSDETLKNGGFFGGEYATWNDRDDADNETKKVLKIIENMNTAQ